MRSSVHPPVTPGHPGVDGKSALGRQEGRFWPLSTLSVPGHPCSLEGPGAYPTPGRTPPLLSPLTEEGWTEWTSRKEPGKQGENVSTLSMDRGMDRDGRPRLRPGQTPSVPPAPPAFPSRARELVIRVFSVPHPPPQAARPALPTAPISLPTAQSPVETAFPCPQGHIPSPSYFGGLHRLPSYRPSIRQPGRSVTAGRDGGDGRGRTKNQTLIGTLIPSACISPAISTIATLDFFPRPQI